MAAKGVISQQQATDLIQEFREHPDLCWELPSTACEARADLMAQIAFDKGYQPEKIWMYPNRGAVLQTFINVAETELVTWSFHVALILRISVNGQSRQFVIDPTLFDAPQEIANWTARYTNSPTDMYWKLGDHKSYYSDSDFIIEGYRAKALVDREISLQGQFNLLNQKIFSSRLQVLRGRMVDELMAMDMGGFDALVGVLTSRDHVTNFTNIFHSSPMSDDFSELLENNKYFYGIPSNEILDSLNFDNPFVYLDFIKTYWKLLIVILKNLKNEAWARMDGGKDSFQFTNLWETDNEHGMNFREEWYTAFAYNLWEEAGVNIETLGTDKIKSR